MSDGRIVEEFEDPEEAVQFIERFEEKGDVKRVSVEGKLDIREYILGGGSEREEEREEERDDDYGSWAAGPSQNGEEEREKQSHPGGKAQDSRCGTGERRKQAIRALKQIPADEWVTPSELVERVPNPEGPDDWRKATASSALSKMGKAGELRRQQSDYGHAMEYQGLDRQATIDGVAEETRHHETLSIVAKLMHEGEVVTSTNIASHSEQDRNNASGRLSELSQRGLVEKDNDPKTETSQIQWKLTEEGREELREKGIYIPYESEEETPKP